MKDFWAQVKKTETCWLWTGKTLYGGYGRFCDGHKAHRANRFSWKLANGPIPPGMNVLHKCDNPPCVRPDHLFLGTQLDNVKDMDTKGRRRVNLVPEMARRAALTHCKKGHPFTKENLYRRKNGTKFCKTCHKARVDRYRNPEQREKINLVKAVL